MGTARGAMVLKASDIDGVKHSYLRSDGDMEKKLYLGNTASAHPWSGRERVVTGYTHMDGQAVFNFATTAMADGFRDMAGVIDLADIDLVVPHQANLRILKSAAKRVKLPLEKFYINIDRYANMSSASIPVAMDEAVRSGRIKKGDKIMMIGFGAGFTWGTALIEWTAG